MSLRCLFVISLSDSTILYSKVFPSVEKRWARDHSAFYKSLPVGQELLELLLTELGLYRPSYFDAERDSCAKTLQAPLFWVLHSLGSESVWPVVVTEYQNRLFCAVPFIKQSRENDQPSTINSPDVSVAFEVLSKLLPAASFESSQLNQLLANIMQQWLPFGRPVGLQGLELLSKPTASQRGLWMRSKPHLDVKIKEEVRAVLTAASTRVELYGSVTFSREHDAELCDIKFQLTFPKMPRQASVVTHPTSHVAVEADIYNFLSQPSQEKTVQTCCYSISLDEAPIQAVFKSRTDDTKSSLFLQLHLTPATRTALTQLEVQIVMPAGSRISRILTTDPQLTGTVSLIKSGGILVWNLTPTSTSHKIKDDVTLNLDVETIPFISLVDCRPSIIFASTHSTLSGALLTFQQPIKFKPVVTNELKSSVYRIWNQQANEIL